MEIPNKIKWLITVVGIVLAIIGPIIAIGAFSGVGEKAFMGVIFSTISWLQSNNLWMITLVLLITTTFESIYLGIALPIIGFAVILALEIMNIISGDKEITILRVLLWVGLIITLIGPIVTFGGFDAYYTIIKMAGTAGVIGPATGNPIGYLGFVLYPNAPVSGFYAGAVLTFIGAGILAASLIVNIIKSK